MPMYTVVGAYCDGDRMAFGAIEGTHKVGGDLDFADYQRSQITLKALAPRKRWRNRCSASRATRDRLARCGAVESKGARGTVETESFSGFPPTGGFPRWSSWRRARCDLPGSRGGGISCSSSNL